MKNIFLFLLSLLLFILASCANSESKHALLTKRIQYDVNIQNSDTEMDWWIQNMEGASREKFIKQLMQQAMEGKVKAYDVFSYKLLSSSDLNEIFKKVDTISIERLVPPYDLVDTVLVKEIRLNDIKRIRFLEEWRMDDNSLAFTKTVLGMCPLVEKLEESGEVRGYKPLFWVFLDKRYPDEFLLKK